MNDQNLLHRFALSHDEPAFAELVARHIQLVYGIARRQMPAEAEDITQAVFLLLSQKARQASCYRTLAGWLFRTTQYCCLNARRLQKRRQFHEREAGRMSHHSITTEEREALVAQLDEAISGLPQRYRETLLLHYLQGKSLEETGSALGVSPGAANKIAGRALERLRHQFAKAGFTFSAAILGTVMMEESSRAIPHGLSHALAKGAGGSGGTAALGTGHAALLAKVTGKSMGVWLWKSAAIAATVAMSTSAALVVHYYARSANAVTSVAFAAEEPINETTVDGNICFTSTELLLDAKAADLLKAKSATIPSESEFFELRQGNAVAIREMLKEIQSNGQLLQSGEFLNTAMNPEFLGGYGMVVMGTGGFRRPIVRNGRAESVRIEFGTPHQFVSGLSAKPGGEGGTSAANLDLKVVVGRASLQSEPLGRNGAPRPPGPNPQGVEHLDKPLSVQWSGNIAPGQTAMLVGDFGEWQGDHLVVVRLFEFYKATELENRYIRNLDFNTWLESGPQELRKSADRAIVWAASGTLPVTKAPDQTPWTKRLSDGTTVQLVAVARPLDMPLCRWSPEGQPLPLPDQSQYISDFRMSRPTGKPQAAPSFTVTLRLSSPTPLMDDGSGRLVRPQDNTRYITPDDINRAHILMGVGVWNVQPIEERGSVKIGNATISLAQVNDGTPGTVGLTAEGDVPPDMEVHLGAITKGKKPIMGSNYPGLWNSVWSPISSSVSQLHIPREQIDHFVVFSRSREEVVFEGFKSSPNIDLPDRTTPQQVRAAEKAIDDREWASEWADYSAYLARIKALPRDPSTPVGGLCIMLDRAMTGDLEGVRDCIDGEEPRKSILAETIVARGRNLNAIMKKFGEENAYRASKYTHNGTLAPKPELAAESWSPKGQSVYALGMVMTLRDGKWRYKLPSDNPGDSAFSQAKAQEDAFLKDLEAGKFKNAIEAENKLQRWFMGVPFLLP